MNNQMHFVVFFYRTPTNFDPILPTEIVFLRTVKNPASPYGASNVYFEILATDEADSFDVKKRPHEGVGKWRE